MNKKINMDAPPTNLGIFKIEFYDSLKIKVSAITIYSDNIIVGDEKGNVYLFQITAKGFKSIPIGKEQKEFINLSSKKVEQILSLDNYNTSFILSNSTVFIFKVPEFTSVNSKDTIKDSVYRIAFNLHNENQTNLLIITKKKKIKFFDFNHEISKLFQINNSSGKELTVEDYPDQLEFYGRWLCYSIKEKGKLYFIDTNDGKEYHQDIEVQSLKYFKGSWLVYTNMIGLFLDKSGPKSISPLTISFPDFVTFGLYKSYIFSLHENSVAVFDPNDSGQVQDLRIGNIEGYAAKFFCLKKDTIFIVTTSGKDSASKIWKLIELPFESQINRMLDKSQFDEALAVLNNNIPSTDETKPTIIEEFYVNCGWTYFKKFTDEGFAKAKDYFKISNFNPFELIYMFNHLLKITPIHEEFKIKSPESLKSTQIENLVGNKDEEKINKALLFLIDVLSNKRKYYMKTYDTTNETNLKIQTLKFIGSSQSVIDLSKYTQVISLLQTLQIINATLVKALVKMKKIKECAEIIDSDECGTDYLGDGYILTLNDNQSKMIRAIICEKKGQYAEALAIWKPFGGNKLEPFVSRPARDRTIGILNIIKNNSEYKNLFEEHIQWMIEFFYEQAFEIILTNTVLPIDYFLSVIIPKVEAEKGTSAEKSTQERFLNYINKNPKYANEAYQTKLIDLYIERIFDKCQRDNPTSPTDPDLKKQYEDLLEIIKSYTLYNKQHVLDYIKNSWMIDIEIFLYTQLGKYNLAEEKLIEIGKNKGDLQEVKDFCKKNILNHKDLYNDLFKILCDDYKNIQKGNDKTAEKLATLLESEIKNILSMFINNKLIDQKNQKGYLIQKFEILDPFLVLNELPQNWNINDKIIYDYLNLVLIEYTHLNNKYKILMNSCDMALAYKKKELADCKNKNVVIDNDTICELCRKKIGTTIFVIYPNMKIYHSKCAPNPSVCPITKEDFSKKKI